MKLKRIIPTLGLAVAMGFGVAAAVGAGQKVEKVEATEGVVKLYLHSDWLYNSHVAAYFWNGDDNGWSDYYTVNNDTTLEIAYDTEKLGFTPAKMILVRYDNAHDKTAWNSNNKFEGSYVWNKTGDLTFVNEAYGLGDGWFATAKPTIYSSEDGWVAPKATLSNIKYNDSNHWEFYSTEIMLDNTEQFKIVIDNNWYGLFNESSVFNFTHDNSGGDGKGGNITCNSENGRFGLYWDSNSKYVYVDNPIVTEANAWGKSFLYEDGSNCSDTKANWSTLAGTYSDLNDDVKELMSTLPYVDEKASPTTYYAKAVQRYDLVIKRYGTSHYSDFMDRTTNASMVYPTGAINNLPSYDGELSTNPILIILITITLTITLGGTALFLIRKRKER